MIKCIHITFSRVQDLGHSISGINQPPPRRYSSLPSSEWRVVRSMHSHTVYMIWD